MIRKRISMGFIKPFIFAVPAAFILFALSSSVSALTCSVNDLNPAAQACDGQFSGNDSAVALNNVDLFGYDDWQFLQKKDIGGGMDTSIDVGLSVTTTNGAQSGSWTVTSDLSSLYNNIAVVLKGGPNWVAYLYDPAINGGDWTTAGLINGGGRQPDLSHLSLYARAAVPEPTTMLLLGAGLVGLAGFGRKKVFKK
jgi:hypothetical protein